MFPDSGLAALASLLLAHTSDELLLLVYALLSLGVLKSRE